jgi:hypothetical protein
MSEEALQAHHTFVWDLKRLATCSVRACSPCALQLMSAPSWSSAVEATPIPNEAAAQELVKGEGSEMIENVESSILDAAPGLDDEAVAAAAEAAAEVAAEVERETTSRSAAAVLSQFNGVNGSTVGSRIASVCVFHIFVSFKFVSSCSVHLPLPPLLPSRLSS